MGAVRRLCLIALVLLSSILSTLAFSPLPWLIHQHHQQKEQQQQQSIPVRSGAWNLSATLEDVNSDSCSFVLTDKEVKPIIRLGKGEKEKVINSFGIWCLLVSLVTGPIWMAAMGLVNVMNAMNEDWDPHGAIYDQTGKVWAKTWLSLTHSYPTFSGEIEHLKKGHGPCLYVANHASWLDIPVICTVLEPVFKFIAKGELRTVPCIGQQLVGVRDYTNDVCVKKKRMVQCC
jgi:Acyltransferase